MVSIWLLGETLLKQSTEFHHHFQIYDPVNQVSLSDQCSIHLLELPKWQKQLSALSKEDEWLYFFQNAKDWEQLPTQLNNPEMRQAMAVLSSFSEKEKAYHLYQSRRIALVEESSKKHLLEEAQQKLIESEHKREESERKMDEAINLANEENKQALIEQERLKVLLKNTGIDPDANIDKPNE